MDVGPSWTLLPSEPKVVERPSSQIGIEVVPVAAANVFVIVAANLNSDPIVVIVSKSVPFRGWRNNVTRPATTHIVVYVGFRNYIAVPGVLDRGLIVGEMGRA